MGKIKNGDDAALLAKQVDVEKLRDELESLMRSRLKGRPESEVPQVELDGIFAEADRSVCRKYGLEIWDALILLRKPDADAPEGFEDWRKVYDWLYHIQTTERLDGQFSEDFAGLRETVVHCESSSAFESWNRAIQVPAPRLASEFHIMLCEVDHERVCRTLAYRIVPNLNRPELIG